LIWAGRGKAIESVLKYLVSGEMFGKDGSNRESSSFEEVLDKRHFFLAELHLPQQLKPHGSPDSPLAVYPFTSQISLLLGAEKHGPAS
jgi:hypothetical protein